METLPNRPSLPTPAIDYRQSPYIVLWELTRSCSLACKHCRAKAIRRRNPEELSFEECCEVLDQLQGLSNPLIVLTGGDPVQREDLFEIIRQAKKRGLTVAITPSATPLTTEGKIAFMGAAGIDRLAISIDGGDAESHDRFRGVNGSFQKSLDICRWASAEKIPVQINTSISKHNAANFQDLYALIEEIDPVLWSVFFLVPTGRANQQMQISAEECEDIMHQMASFARSTRRAVKATAAPHFRRVLIECSNAGDRQMQVPNGSPAARVNQPINDGKGVVFISHTGEIYPSGFLPISAGNVRTDSLKSVYRDHDLFQALRDVSQLKGKCGICRYKHVCGGSRARAFAVCGDFLESDPLCSYREDFSSTKESGSKPKGFMP